MVYCLDRKDNDMKPTRKEITECLEKFIADPAVINSATWEDAALLHEAMEYALKNLAPEAPAIYAAWMDGNPHALFTGKQHDIEAYVDDEGYDIDEIGVTEVPSGYAAHMGNIVRKRDKLQAEVDELNKRLREKDIHR
jgi:hypothetical protein